MVEITEEHRTIYTYTSSLKLIEETAQELSELCGTYQFVAWQEKQADLFQQYVRAQQAVVDAVNSFCAGADAYEELGIDLESATRDQHTCKQRLVVIKALSIDGCEIELGPQTHQDTKDHIDSADDPQLIADLIATAKVRGQSDELTKGYDALRQEAIKRGLVDEPKKTEIVGKFQYWYDKYKPETKAKIMADVQSRTDFQLIADYRATKEHQRINANAPDDVRSRLKCGAEILREEAIRRKLHILYPELMPPKSKKSSASGKPSKRSGMEK